MQLARPQVKVRPVPSLLVVALVVAAVAVVSFLAGANLPALASWRLDNGSQIYNVNLPDRANTFLQTTTTQKWGRVRLEEGGADAALTAIYLNDSALQVILINAQSGQGTLAYNVTAEELAAAKLQAATTNSWVLVVPTAFLEAQAGPPAPTATRNPRLRRTPTPAPTAEPDLNPRIYAMQNGKCTVDTNFADGRPAQFTFIC